MFADIKTLIDIKDFQKALVTSFENKGIINTFKNQTIQAPKKNFSANIAGFENRKEVKKDTPESKKKIPERVLKIKNYS